MPNLNILKAQIILLFNIKQTKRLKNFVFICKSYILIIVSSIAKSGMKNA